MTARLTPLAGLGILCFAILNLGCGESALLSLGEKQNGSGGASGLGMDGGEADTSGLGDAQDPWTGPQADRSISDVRHAPDSVDAGECPAAAPKYGSPCSPLGLKCTGYATPIVDCWCTDKLGPTLTWTCTALLY